MRGSLWRVTATLVLGVAAVTSCSGGSDGPTAGRDDGSGEGRAGDREAAADGATVPGDDWTVVEPEEHGIDAETLDAARDYAFTDGMNTQGVVVVHRGEIVGEWYADGADEESWAASWSMAKSFTSALIGIAIEDGLIPGVDEPMTTWYPEWEGTDRAAITLGDVLQMSSGLDWVEDYDPDAIGASDIIRQVTVEEDQLAYAASQPPAHEPGTVWNYSSGDTMLLSGVLQQVTGMPVDEYARQEIFDPLGMEQAEWWRDARGHTLTYCCLDTTSRNFARFGLLYEHQGRWGAQQLVPEAWVADSLEPAPASEGQYGYQWWLGLADGVEGGEAIPDDTFAAQGHDGQYIYVIPSLDLVVVRNGLYVKDPGPPVADPALFPLYPSDGLVPGKGTINPEGDWDVAAFLTPVIESLPDD